MNNLLVLYQTDSSPNNSSHLSWKIYCEKHNIKLNYFNYIVNNKLDRTNQIFYFYKILESNNIDIDNIAFIADTTLVNQNTPNLFNFTDTKLKFAEWDSDFSYLFTNLEVYNDFYFKMNNLDFTRFFDLSFFIVNKLHKEFFNNIINFLEENYEEINNKLDTSFIPQNFFFNCEYKKLPYTWNMIDMFRKEITLDANLKKIGFIFNFKGIPNKEKIMEQLVNLL